MTFISSFILYWIVQSYFVPNINSPPHPLLGEEESVLSGGGGVDVKALRSWYMERPHREPRVSKDWTLLPELNWAKGKSELHRNHWVPSTHWLSQSQHRTFWEHPETHLKTALASGPILPGGLLCSLLRSQQSGRPGLVREAPVCWLCAHTLFPPLWLMCHILL